MTIKELATELNMSTTTVSRVLTGQEKKYRISDKTAQIVRDKIDALGFAPNQIARNLRLQKTNTIGLVIPDISNQFFANLARAIEEELRKRGKMVLLCDTKDSTSLEEQSLELLMARKVDGLLVAPVGNHWEHLSKHANVPIVLIDRHFEEDRFPYVSTDNYDGAYQATNYLIAQGHRNIACIQGIPGTSANHGRVSGFKAALKENQLIMDDSLIVGDDYSVENGYTSTQSLLQREPRPTAIFAMNNQIAIGVLKATGESHVQVPEDISLVSFDEQTYFELLSPPLTSVKQPMMEIGKKSVDLLFQRLEGKEVQSCELKPELILRSSVKSIPVL